MAASILHIEMAFFIIVHEGMARKDRICSLART